MKRYLNISIIYLILALIGGVFFREFTKFNDFTGNTYLSIVHTHYFILGFLVFIILLLLEKNFNITNKKTNVVLITYQIGLNLTIIMFIVRGILQVVNPNLTNGINSMISGIAGVGHIILGISLVWLIIEIRKIIVKA